MLLKIFPNTGEPCWINPDHISLIQPGFTKGTECLIGYTGSEDGHYVSNDEAKRIIDLINGAWPEAGEADTPSPIEQAVKEILLQEVENAAKTFTTPPIAPAQPIVSLDSFKAMIRRNDFVVLDTETTGLEDGEIVQIAILDSTGMTLLDTLVKPKQPIPADATRIHGITDEMVKDAPTWETVRGQVYSFLSRRHCVVYNAVYDRKMMHKSAERWGLPKTEWKEIAAFWCAMEAFAEQYGEWNEYRNSYKWQKLEKAANYYGVTIDGTAHTALTDCRTTLAVCKAMAGQ